MISSSCTGKASVLSRGAASVPPASDPTIVACFSMIQRATSSPMPEGGPGTRLLSSVHPLDVP